MNNKEMIDWQGIKLNVLKNVGLSTIIQHISQTLQKKYKNEK